MPKTKSAKKALRSSERKRLHNLMHKKRIKATEKKIKKAIEEKKIEEAKELLKIYYKFVDKAAKENVIKRNTASRKKSKMTKLVLKRI
jgi:small subunit ribosomal protein S20